MPRHFLIACVALCGACLTTDIASAQLTRSPRARPAVSPYLNLLRTNSVGLNYYGLVRPQQEFRRGVGQLRFDLGNLRRESYGVDDASLDPRLKPRRTGHRTEFDSDLKSRPRLMNLEIVERRTASLRPNRPAAFSRLPRSGHRAFFGNYGNYYREIAPPR